MAETATKPVSLKAAPDAEADGKDGGGGKDAAGRLMDVAGVCAAIVLGVILFDIVSGGRVTRLLRGKRGGCEGCGEQEPSGDS